MRYFSRVYLRVMPKNKLQDANQKLIQQLSDRIINSKEDVDYIIYKLERLIDNNNNDFNRCTPDKFSIDKKYSNLDKDITIRIGEHCNATFYKENTSEIEFLKRNTSKIEFMKGGKS